MSPDPVSPAAPFRLIRSLLSVPAANPRALAKSDSLDADGIIIDLEDSVADSDKVSARGAMMDHLARLAGQRRSGHGATGHLVPGRMVLVRINAPDTQAGADDIAALAAAAGEGRGPDGVVIPKVDDPRALALVAEALEAGGGEALRLWAMMETPRAILNAAAIAEAGRGVRLDGMIVGLNDLRKETRVAQRPGRPHVGGWLMQVVLAARAYGLAAIDSVSNDFSDLGAFGAECAEGAAMGFDGKMLIHPAQIGPANAAFLPSAEDLAEARAIIAAFDDPAAGNVANLGGRMVERLHLDGARRLVALVDVARKRD